MSKNSFYYYQLYNLIIKTTQYIPHLLLAEPCKKVDVFIDFKRTSLPTHPNPHEKAKLLYASLGKDSDEIPYFQIWKQVFQPAQYLLFRYTRDGAYATYSSNLAGDHLKIYFTEKIPVGDVITYLLGPVIGCLLRLKNKVLLHASVVNINEKAVAFIGEKTAGKSTLIASFAALGYPILSDDIAVLSEDENDYLVAPGYPRLRLWKNTIDRLAEVQLKNLSPVLSLVEKFYLPLSNKITDKNYKFQTTYLPLKTIYYLAPRNEHNICSIKEQTIAKSFLKIITNSYAPYMSEGFLKINEYIVLGNIANEVAGKILERPNNLSAMNAVCQLIIKEESVS